MHKHVGYKILWSNVLLNEYGPVEDWYVNEELYNKFRYLEANNINCLEITKI